MRRIIFIIILLIVGFSSNGQNVETCSYKYRYYKTWRKTQKIFIVTHSICQDTIKMRYDQVKNSKKLFITELFLTVKDSSVFLMGVTEFKLNKKSGYRYQTVDNICSDGDDVDVCIKKINQDTVINNVSYTYNIYEMYYSKFIGHDDTHDMRYYFDYSKKLIIKRESFSDEYVYVKEELIE